MTHGGALLCVAILGFFGVPLDGAEKASGMAHAFSRPSELTTRVVSYLVSEAAPPEAWFGDSPFQAVATDWRVYDPETGRDFSYLRLRGVPTRIRWERSFRFVEYKLGDRVYWARWAPNANPTEILRLPADSTICDFWEDPQAGRWSCALDRHLPEFTRSGYLYTPSAGEVWTSTDGGARWVLVRSDSCWGDEGCDCAQGRWLAAAGNSRVKIEELLDSMRVEHHPYHVLTHSIRDSEAEALVATTCAWDSGCRLEFFEGFGDTDHAMAPLVYVNESRGIRRTVYEVPDTSVSFGQIGFQEEGRYLLVAGEYVGANPAVIDLRDGRTLLGRLDAAFGAVWVPWDGKHN